MITLLQVRPVVGSPLELNTLDYPIHEFDPVPEIDEAKAKKMSNPGEWPTFSYEGAMYIPIVGDIVGDDTNDYVTKRTALMTACRHPVTATGVLTSRKIGALRLQMDGWSEAADVDFTTITLSAPMTTQGWSVSEFRWSVKCFLPYFTGVTSGDPYYV